MIESYPNYKLNYLNETKKAHTSRYFKFMVLANIYMKLCPKTKIKLKGKIKIYQYRITESMKVEDTV